jgi:hypothetical protein
MPQDQLRTTYPCEGTDCSQKDIKCKHRVRLADNAASAARCLVCIILPAIAGDAG